jgi:Flp pilus assembly protein TadD
VDANQQILGRALEHHQAGRLKEAEALYRQILAKQPNEPDALNLLGVLAMQTGRYDLAVNLIQRGIVARPDFAEAHFNLGYAHQHHGRLDDAIASYRRALDLNPEYPDGYNNLGNALRSKGNFDEAIACYRRALALRPDHLDAHNNLGAALQESGGLEEATTSLGEAVACYRKAIELNPTFADAHFNLGMALLLLGDFERGLPEYGWRWKCKEFASQRREFPQAQWDGGDLRGRTIFLYTEQGLGDAIQFLRYCRLVSERGGKVIVECQPALKRLLRGVAGIEQIVGRGEPLPHFDVQCPLLTLPLVLATTRQNIPSLVPYLKADEQAVKRWAQRFASDDRRLKVGLCWAGSPKFRADQLRSPRELALFAPLGKVQGVSWYSLQKGAAAEQAKHPPAGLNLVDWTSELADFADTAALIANLDLVVTSDTAVAHLAGALGKPVWTLLSFVPDWRWMLDRADSPWYPTMRLFRQPKPGDWRSTIDQVIYALADKARSSSAYSFSVAIWR